MSSFRARLSGWDGRFVTQETMEILTAGKKGEGT